MTEFLPFRGIIYDNTKVNGNDVFAPPYDIIGPQRQEELYRKSEYNIVRIDFGRDASGTDGPDNRYSKASDYLSEWLARGVLRRLDKDAFYIYEAAYRYLGETLKLRGIIGRVRIVELGQGVYPHEETHSKPKKDRLSLMKACKANVSPIFSLYNSPDRIASKIIEDTAASSKPYMEALDDWGVIHRLWIIDDDTSIKAISSDISRRPIFIADGHHRYETALEYRNEMRSISDVKGNAPFDYVMMFLANISDPGLTILPTHRLVDSVPGNFVDILSQCFEISLIDKNTDINKLLLQSPGTIGMFHNDLKGFYLLKPVSPDLEDTPPALRGLDVVVLHELIFKKLLNIDIITYEMDTWRCIEMVKKGKHAAVFFLSPTEVGDIEKVAMNSVRMPPKSTYFFPKLMTGTVLNPFV
ncbi:hypothetical protein BMS3Abin07_00635 [bacterium BMS3Abin07]|nr:hypothetical protein BMS3Abin07_00635 [bacterium BMS3Abin07]GBE32804.1 hypothetical protein BMS3Bbin05_01727 [bacterium BMS3Bbin05]HDL20917.1 DUF1015 domain-containing protein [Nitrospirota bacterium]HDO23481.1 DUF1015 domain-containing protein [Nitrospirota bacterium]HDZ88165.1 DUF1015 domain-containing protein [Nitrospirota bacterium]